jgi:pimeloyl-ACP methyl ester carboxylesterase
MAKFGIQLNLRIMKAPNIVPISTPLEHGEYTTRLYEGVKKRGLRSNYEDVIVLAPGWLGRGTLHFAASALARKGHDVAVVSHGRRSIFHPNLDRQRNVHYTSRAASRATGKRGVILVGHSNGNQDIHHAAEEALVTQAEHPEDPDMYVIRAIGSLAGAGLSGRHINMREMHREVFGSAREFIGHPIEELDVVGRSMANFCAHPVLAVVEGVGASRCDVRNQAKIAITQGSLRSYHEFYLNGDGVIPKPQHRNDYHSLSGHHLTPLVNGEIMETVGELMYSDNQPQNLQLARTLNAA